MKYLLLKTFVYTALVTTSMSFSQSCPVPEPLDKAAAIGTWKGNFTLNGELKLLQLNLSEKNNKLTVSLVMPTISKKNIKTETKVCQSEELHVKFKVNKDDYELVGRIKNKTMSGRLSSKSEAIFSTEDKIQEIFSLKKSNNTKN